MNAFLDGFGRNFAAHEALYTAGISALLVAFVCTWPAGIPRTPQEWWTWFRDAFQTAVPAARMNHANGQNANPTNPANPDKPKQ